MKTTANTYVKPNHNFQSLILQLPSHYTPYTSHTSFSPELKKYLSHYNIDALGKGIATSYGIWKTHDMHSYTIVQQYWQAKPSPQGHIKGTLIICHGYFDHSGLYGRLIEWGLQHHYHVLCFDLPGHGLSNGEPATITHFDEYTRVFELVIQQAKTLELITTPLCAIGQSTGCSVITNYLFQLQQPSNHQVQIPLDQIILLAPLVRSFGWGCLRWLYFLLRPFVKHIQRRFIDSSHDSEFNRFLAQHDSLQSQRIPLAWLGAMETWHQTVKTTANTDQNHYPLHIIQGTGDKTVDWRFNLSILKVCFPSTTIHYIPKCRHHIVKESPLYWQQAETFISKILS